ncbi:MAG: gliding motility-associated C-terminal domain-containing protein [Bacteroidetes bacterium]|nr:gliding motility-associated C-terminal domain-containing protein [Bacteroidota bacterium]
MLAKILILLFLFSIGFAVAQERNYSVDIHHTLIENKGQWPNGVLFQSKLQGGNLWVEEGRFLYHLVDNSGHNHAVEHELDLKEESIKFRETYVSVEFLNGNKKARIIKEDESSNYYSYFLGNDSTKWASEVRGYQKVIRKEFYRNIDFQLVQEANRLKYEFIVKPGGDFREVILEYKGVEGLKIDKKGNLVASTQLGQIIEEKPYAYQIVNGKFKEISCQYVIDKNQVSFSLGRFDESLDLIIDPLLIFATYNGAVSDNFGMTATYGYDGTAYSGGTVFGNNYPKPDPMAVDFSPITVGNTNYQCTDVFISKYSPDGSQMLWSAFLGGGNNNSGTETVHSLICDSNNVLYLFGATSSQDFPVTSNAFQSTFNGGVPINFASNGSSFSTGTDLYVSKISENGHNLLSSTYIGGSGNDGLNYNENQNSRDSLMFNYGDWFRGEIMLGPQREVIVGSCTRSKNFPTLNAYKDTLDGLQDGIVFSLRNDLSVLNFSTYFGGTKKDVIHSIKVDSALNIVFAGGTSSNDLPGTIGHFQTTYGGGKADGFISKFSFDGTILLGTTYFGFLDYDQIYFVEIDRNNKVFVTGQGTSGTLPIVNSPFFVDNSAMFILKFDENLTVLERATTFGKQNSNLRISPTAFLVDRCGEIYVSGWGNDIFNPNGGLSGFPITNDAVQPNPHAVSDFYLIVIDRSFSNLVYGSYLGDLNSSDHVDGGTSRFDQQGVVYQSICGGCGGSDTWPTTPGAWSNTNNSVGCNNVVFKFDYEILPVPRLDLADTTVCLGAILQLENNSSNSDDYFWDLGNGQTSTEFEPTIQFSSAGTYVIKLVVRDSVCKYTDTAQLTVVVGDPLTSMGNDSLFSCGVVDTVLVPTFTGNPSFFHWSSNPNFTDTLNNYPADSSLQISIVSGTKYYLEFGDSLCDVRDSVVVYNLKDIQKLIPKTTFCDDTTQKVVVTSFLPASFKSTHVWSPISIILGSNTEDTVTVKANDSQYLYITTTTSYNCVLYDSVFVEIKKLADLVPTISANPVLVPKGAISNLSSSGGLIYAWSPTEGVFDPTSANTKVKMNKNTTFTVNVSDGFCSKSLDVDVNVYEFACDAARVYVPNAFTPNGDQENDLLYVRSEVTESVELKIFNRWGELVFQTNDISIGWDGTYKGKDLSPDVYDFYIEAGCVDGQKFFNKGNITLIR